MIDIVGLIGLVTWSLVGIALSWFRPNEHQPWDHSIEEMQTMLDEQARMVREVRLTPQQITDEIIDVGRHHRASEPERESDILSEPVMHGRIVVLPRKEQ